MEQTCLPETQHCVLHYYATEKHKDGWGSGLTKFLIFLLVSKKVPQYLPEPQKGQLVQLAELSLICFGF